MLGIIILVAIGVFLYTKPMLFGKICSKTYNGLGNLANNDKPQDTLNKFKDGWAKGTKNEK